MIDSMNEQSKEGEKPSKNIYIQPTKGFRREERSENDCDFNRKKADGGGADIMSEENKNYFLESVTSAATLWCNKAITSDDLLRIIRKTVDETEKRIKIDPESWAV